MDRMRTIMNHRPGPNIPIRRYSPNRTRRPAARQVDPDLQASPCPSAVASSFLSPAAGIASTAATAEIRADAWSGPVGGIFEKRETLRLLCLTP